MKEFETILQFVRATRQRDLLLHLESTEAFIKYFLLMITKTMLVYSLCNNAGNTEEKSIHLGKIHER